MSKGEGGMRHGQREAGPFVALQATGRNLDFLLKSDEKPLGDFKQGVICSFKKDQSGCSVENRPGKKGLRAA